MQEKEIRFCEINADFEINYSEQLVSSFMAKKSFPKLKVS